MAVELLKVMVVDDEEIARSFLKMCINWNEIGMEMVCEASSGREALDLIEEYNPEIIFTDIQMPFMDGLEFSRTVAETHPHIRIVILTAHKEFDYAKKGIKIGVSDFLLKPINRAEVLKIALGLKEKIEAERRHWEEFHQIRRQLEESHAYMKEKFLLDLLENSASMDGIMEKLDYFYPDEVPDYFQATLVETAHSEAIGHVGEEQRLVLGLRSMDIVKQYFRDDKNVDVFFDNSRRIVILTKEPEIDLTVCGEQIKALVINRVKCYASIGIGTGYRDIRLISRSYREALDALKYSIVSGRNQVVFFQDDMNLSGQHWDYSGEDIRELGFLVKAGLDEKAVCAAETVFSHVAGSRNFTIEQVRVVSTNIISAVLNAVAEMGLEYREILGSEKLPYGRIFEIETLAGMKEFLNELIRNTANSIKSIRTRKCKKIIDDIKAYMRDNLSDFDMSLSSVAHAFYVNPSYLSRIFKQETGQSFTEYLSRIRLEKAVELLSKTDMKAYQVADAVGIKDPFYFSNCFKKFTGLSVNEFKKS
jgi:two-component system response regulator YesN